jgi:hypothetical protein
MVKDNVQIFDFLDSGFDVAYVAFHFVSKFFPSLLNIISLINVKSARVRTELFPNRGMHVDF